MLEPEEDGRPTMFLDSVCFAQVVDQLFMGESTTMFTIAVGNVGNFLHAENEEDGE